MNPFPKADTLPQFCIRYHQRFSFSPANIILILIQAGAEACRSVGFNQNWRSLHTVTYLYLSCRNAARCLVRCFRASRGMNASCPEGSTAATVRAGPGGRSRQRCWQLAQVSRAGIRAVDLGSAASRSPDARCFPARCFSSVSTICTGAGNRYDL